MLWFAMGVYETGWQLGAAPSTHNSVAIANLSERGDKSVESECIDGLLYTAPLMRSIACSLTAWLTLKFRSPQNSAD
jgi:hypothetical protein